MIPAQDPGPARTLLAPVRVLIADPQEFARVGITTLLQRSPQVRVVGTAEDAPEALRLVERDVPDVVLVDTLLPPAGWSGLARGLRRLGAAARRTAMLLVAQELSDDILLRAVRSGMHGYVLKDSPDWVLSAAIRSAAAGEPFLAGPVLRRLFGHFTLRPNHEPGTVPGELAALGTRELEVLRGIGTGLSNREIAQQLGIAETTIKSYASGILARLGVRNRVELALLACRVGLVPCHPAGIPTQPGPPV